MNVSNFCIILAFTTVLDQIARHCTQKKLYKFLILRNRDPKFYTYTFVSEVSKYSPKSTQVAGEEVGDRRILIKIPCSDLPGFGTSIILQGEMRKRPVPLKMPVWSDVPSFDNSDIISLISLFIQLMFYQHEIQQSRQKNKSLFPQSYIIEEKRQEKQEDKKMGHKTKVLVQQRM